MRPRSFSPLLGDTGVDFIHTTEYKAYAPAFGDGSPSLAALAKRYSGLPVIANGNLDDPETAEALLADGTAMSLPWARPLWATETGRERVRHGRPLDELDASLFAPLADVKDWELELLS